jgi:hypothetical protein
LLPAVPGKIIQTHSTSDPKAVRCNNSHQADAFMSCKRRAPTAKLGTRTNTKNPHETGKPTAGPENEETKALIIIHAKMVNKTNHQYSAREARPEKVAYLPKQAMTASKNDMAVSNRLTLAWMLPDHGHTDKYKSPALSGTFVGLLQGF